MNVQPLITALFHPRLTGNRAVTDDDDVIEQCRSILSKHARSFKWASLFLPASTRDNVVVLYAFCRILDDAVDTSPDTECARDALRRIAASLAQTTPEEPIIAAFKAMASRSIIDLIHVEHLIEGIASDLDPVRVQDDAQLIRYCYRVASTVGLMMCRVLGVTDERGMPHAIDLGIAMQLTNICRDVAEDAAANRVYLPARMLEDLGSSQERLVSGSAEPDAVAAVVRQLLAVAEQYYRSADAGMRYIPAQPRLAIIIASRIYRAIGLSLLRRFNGNSLRGRVVVPWTEKTLWVWRGLALWLFTLIKTTQPPHDPRLHRYIKDLPGANG